MRPMSCPAIIAGAHATVREFKLYFFQANLTTDLTGTIAMLKEKFGGAIDALKNALPNTDNGRKRSLWKIPVN